MTDREIALEIKQRINREDNLVNQRTNIFLVINGLGAVAIGLGSTVEAKHLIAVVTVILNGFWIILSIQCLAILFRLTKKLVDMGIEEDVAENIVQTTLGRSLFFRPNAILNIHIPAVITGAWIISLFYLKS